MENEIAELSNYERMQIIVSLNKGIVPLSLDLREEFKRMGPEEARVAKRKFRKMKRKHLKEGYIKTVKFVSKQNQMAKSAIRRDIDVEARSILNGTYSKTSS